MESNSEKGSKASNTWLLVTSVRTVLVESKTQATVDWELNRKWVSGDNSFQRVVKGKESSHRERTRSRVKVLLSCSQMEGPGAFINALRKEPEKGKLRKKEHLTEENHWQLEDILILFVTIPFNNPLKFNTFQIHETHQLCLPALKLPFYRSLYIFNFLFMNCLWII